MVEKVNALCKAIDTVNHLPGCENNDKAVDELVGLLLAECKQMVEQPARRYGPSNTFIAGNKIEAGDILYLGTDNRVYPGGKLVPVLRPYDKDIDNPLT